MISSVATKVQYSATYAFSISLYLHYSHLSFLLKNKYIQRIAKFCSQVICIIIKRDLFNSLIFYNISRYFTIYYL